MNNQIELWEKIFSERTPTLYPYDSVVSFVFRNFPKDKQKDSIRVLDVGCGGGNNLLFVAELGFKAYGIDGSANAINIAKQRFDQKKLSAELYVGDFKQLPFEPNFFDLVIDRGAICCVDKIGVQRTIQEIHRVMISGGIFYSSTYADDHTSAIHGQLQENGITSNITKGSLQGFGNLSFFNQAELEELYAKDWEIRSLKHKQYREFYGNENIHTEWEVVARKI